MKKILIPALLLALLGSCNKKESFDSFLYVGTYTSGDSNGINIFKFNTENGASSFIKEVDINDPSYLAISDQKDLLFAVSEGDSITSAVTSYSINPQTGLLIFISRESVPAAPCFISISETANLGLTANYTDGSMTEFQISNDGKIKISDNFKYEGHGLDSVRQEQPHVHSVNFAPNGSWVYVTDLGTDKIYKYDLGYNGDSLYIMKDSQKDFNLEPGSGPRHLTFHPKLDNVYVLTEISGDIVSYNIDENGDLFEQQKIKADKVGAKGSADIHITPDGKYLYASNRLKNDGLTIFSVNDISGELTEIGYLNTGLHPRNFTITPNGKLLLVANKDSNNIQIFEIKKDGLLKDINKDINLSNPVCVKIFERNK